MGPAYGLWAQKKKSKGHQYDCQYFRKFSGAGEVPMNEKFCVYSPEEATKRSEESASSKWNISAKPIKSLCLSRVSFLIEVSVL